MVTLWKYNPQYKSYSIFFFLFALYTEKKINLYFFTRISSNSNSEKPVRDR